MNLFWKLFCSMVSITILACALGGFVLIDGQFRASLGQEVQALYEENDMLRYALSRELEGQTPASRKELSQLAKTIVITTGGQKVVFRLSCADGTILFGGDFQGADSTPLTAALSEEQRGWRMVCGADNRVILHGASALPLPSETMYLENRRDVTALFTQRAAQYQSFVGVMLALIAGAAVLSLLVSHLILRPLTCLSAATRKMADGALDIRVPVTSGDELGQLSADFNAMAARLQAQVEALTDAARREKDFTGSFAHEIKTPLTSIIGYADLLLSRPASPELVQESAGYIFREGRRLEALSRKLMDLIVLDQQDFPLRPVAMHLFLIQTAHALRPAMERAGIHLETDVEEAIVHLEPDLMETVCLNLLDNARKATEKGGRITLTGQAENGGYLIQVTDTGKGIPAEELSRITEPFYMVDKSRARAQGGAGLGLALCRRIVELHGGTMEFESVPGLGTAARVRLKGDEET